MTKIPAFRLVLLLLLFTACLLTLLSSGLLSRWYGQIIGDTFEIKSRLLSDFRAAPTFLRAFIVVPISAKDNPQKRFPAIYHLHGFGGDYQDAASEASRLRSRMMRNPETEMVHVFLDVSIGDGYHYFVNSMNTGPWEKALIEEFIPQFESIFPVIAQPNARFLTGHSSGGWSAMWLQVNHPDFFGGVWSVSPDPLDFRDFFGINISQNSQDNVYIDSRGKRRKVARSGKLKNVFMADYVSESEEDLDSHCDSDFGSYECAFSPKASDGQPQLLFDRNSGKLDLTTVMAWSNFDIRKILEQHWAELGPKLAGKLHLFCGSHDDFFLDSSFLKFCEFLKSRGFENSCNLEHGRGHENIYLPSKSSPQGLSYRIQKEARAVFEGSSSQSQP